MENKLRPNTTFGLSVESIWRYGIVEGISQMTFTRSPSIWLDIFWVLASVPSREIAQSMGVYQFQGSSKDAFGCRKPRLFCEVLQEGKVKLQGHSFQTSKSWTLLIAS